MKETERSGERNEGRNEEAKREGNENIDARETKENIGVARRKLEKKKKVKRC
jgi:hypothetical protein